MTFDTLALAQRLREKGFDQEKAEAIVSSIRDSQADLFTKADGEMLLANLHADIAKVSAQVGVVATQVKMLIWMIAVLGIGGILLRVLHLI